MSGSLFALNHLVYAEPYAMNEKKKLLITVAVVVVAVLLEGVFIYLGMKTAGDFPFDGPDGLVAKIDGKVRQIKAQQDKFAEIPAAEVKLKGLRSEQVLAMHLLPKEQTPTKYVQYFREIGKEAGVEIVRLYTKQPKAASDASPFGNTGSFEEWDFDMNLKGTFNQIVQFVNGMEQFELPDSGRRFFAIKDIDIVAEDNGMTVSGVSRVRILLQTYRYTAEDEK